jgi:hypothetical protein
MWYKPGIRKGGAGDTSGTNRGFTKVALQTESWRYNHYMPFRQTATSTLKSAFSYSLTTCLE